MLVSIICVNFLKKPKACKLFVIVTLKRENFAGKLHTIGYHTQESRLASPLLENPVICVASNAWLGVGYYFWTEEEFAHYWGQDSKKATGAYDIYTAYLDCDNCLNTVFDEQGYLFFRERIEETIEHFKQNGIEPSLEQVNRFLADNIWQEIGVEGILYDDKPRNSKRSDRVYSSIPELYYKKRIQVVLFTLKNVSKFTVYLTKQPI